MTERHFLRAEASQAAEQLLGCILEREIDGEVISVRIVETEAYDQTDSASHSYKGRTPRTEIMFGAAGRLYVYFTYGMHYCCNVVVGEVGCGAAVLIRAVEPLNASQALVKRRGGRSGIQLTNGPAKLCQALGIDTAMNGHDLQKSPLRLIDQPQLPARDITTATRIGIKTARDVMWRYYITDNPYVSVRYRDAK